MKKTLKIASLILLVAALVFSLAACRPRQAAVGQAFDTIIYRAGGSPVHMDPTLSNDMPSAIMHGLIFSTLIVADNDMNLIPGLAESWEWDAPDRLRLFLRRGVIFHNGAPFTASDVKFSLERASIAPQVAMISDMIAGVEIINDFEVVVVLRFPFVPFASHLAHTANSILSESTVNQMGVDAHTRNPVGTGPYRFVEWVTGDRVVLTRWDGYWGTPAVTENFIYRVMPDVSTALLALEAGEIHIVDAPLAADINRIRNNRDLYLHLVPNLSIDYIGMTVNHPPFNDVRVRRAVQYAIDMEALVEAVWRGSRLPLDGPINPSVWGSIAQLRPQFPYDPDRARQLLAEAGFPNGFNTTFFTNEGNQARADHAEIIANMLRQVGINMEIRIVEWTAYLDLTARQEAPFFMLGWVSVTGDPDYGLFPLFHSSAIGEAGNRTGFSHPRVDALLDEGRRETDPDRRLAIYREVQELIQQEAPWIFANSGTNLVATRANIVGFVPHPTGRHRFQDAGFR